MKLHKILFAISPFSLCLLLGGASHADAPHATDCVEDIGEYFFAAEETDLATVSCTSHKAAGSLGQKFTNILRANRKMFNATPDSKECQRAFEHLLQEVMGAGHKVCGSPADGAAPVEQQLFDRCNLDQDIINTVLMDARSGVPSPEMVKACPSGVQLGLVTNFVVRQENIEFLKNNGMPERLDPWWMETTERARALYLIVLHADNDREFQQQMITQLKPFVGKTMSEAFFENLKRRVTPED